ncbi:hypothetical protein CAPTEDRAFT_150315 [Capitella teleta]|uniref:Twinfilin n=1 Tax=Capitella teleta TaxID=283909 RepID=R7V0H2_CAPTE|nr:hypothetical protein CAPTEDRAFT_150315 [Capitella teleta]|eukprot:ELU12338.1 hypothetical protein CAPTEDRAFT_150315 [Capitella teleta]
MSHQTGITASDHLQSFLANSKSGSVRSIKISIAEEKLVLAHSDPPRGTWEDDWDPLVVPQLEEKQPCFIMYRLDSANEMGYQWIFISYSPDFSPVRQKMLFAATRATMKREFGGGQITDELFGTAVDDVNLDGYRKHLTAKSAPPPLTMAEEELQLINKTEVAKTSILGNKTANHLQVKNDGASAKHQTLTGLAFPVSRAAQDEIHRLMDRAITYVQLSIDQKNETIELSSTDTVDAKGLRSRIPTDAPRYHIFLYKHNHEGDYMESIGEFDSLVLISTSSFFLTVFIYSMPGYKCPIKERMLYSSCKNPFLASLEDGMKMQIARKLEIDDPAEVTEDFIYAEVHPAKNIVKTQFARPKGPAGRGPKRMTKK